MRNLILGSILLFLSSCVPPEAGKLMCRSGKLPALASELPQTFFEQPGSEFVYQASLGFSFTHFSGILVFKMMENGNLRASLITEIGSKVFDIEMSDTNSVVHYAIGPLRKSNRIIELIEDDFRILFFKGNDVRKNKLFGDSNRMVLRSKFGKKKVYYFSNASDRKVNSVKRLGGMKGKLHIFFSDYNEKYPDNILITHPRIHLSIRLTLREKNKS